MAKGDSQPTIWTQAPHTAAKHDLLRRYLGGWFPVLSTWHRRVIFLDGFAGPGIYEGGQPGSPILALNTFLDHSHFQKMQATEFLFIFNERDQERFASLEQVIERIRDERGGWPSNVRVHTVNEAFVGLAEGMLTGLGDQQLAPTFAFLDPFGYEGIPLAVIARLLSFQRCELFIYFDFNSANRFATAGLKVDPLFEALYGTDEFKQAPPAGDPRRKTFLHDLYARQLKSECGFEYVQSFEMVTDKNRTGSYLFFCTRNLKGVEIMKDAMWKVAPAGNFRFSDLLAGQTILFGADVDTTPLQQELRKRFSGRRVSIKDVEEYTLAQTPYTKSHVKRKTLLPMQQAGLIDSPNQKRPFTYPDGTLIDFP